MESKRVIQILVVALALVVIGFAYFQLSETSGDRGNPLKQTPETSTILCMIDGLDGSDGEREFLNTLLKSTKENSAYAGWSSMLATLDSLRKTQRDWYDLLQRAPIIFATQDALNANGWSMSVGLDAGVGAEKMMSHWLADTPGRSFKGTTMHVGKSMSWCTIENCLVLSPSPAVLEQVIISSANGDVLAVNPEFNTAYDLRSKDVPLHLFAKINEQAWLQLDPIFNAQGTMLTGYYTQSGPDKHALQLSTVMPVMPGIYECLPSNSMLVDVVSTEASDSLWHQLSQYYDGSDASNYWTEVWQSVGDSCQCDLNELLLSWRSGECGSAMMALPDSSDASVAFIGVRDTIDVIALLQPLILEPTSQTQNIHTLKYPAVFERNCLPTIPIEHNYIMHWKNYVFTASTPSQLQLIQNSANTLSKDADFSKANANVNANAARYCFQRDSTSPLLPVALSELLSGQSSFVITTEVTPGEKSLIGIGLDIRTSASPAPVKAPEPIAAAIETTAEANTTSGNSWTVINHNTREKEQLECDAQGKLTLKDAAGKVLWTRNLGAPVLGDVVQVDALKNEKLQYVFTTASGLYLIDRNGKDVTGFPYLPKPPVTSPLLVADYDNTKKYRLIFAMGDDMIVNMSVDGKITSGWKYQPKNTGSKITAIESAKVGSDDVLFAVSADGKIQLLKRTGEEKSPCNTVLEQYNGGPISIVPGSELNGTAIVYSTASGERTTQIQLQ